MQQSARSKIARLSVFTLTMITVGSVDSIRNLPATALFGSSLIFFFILAAVCFLIPCALVSGELSSTFSQPGGVYTWVKKAFGKQFGFVAIWFQWIENVIWYPTILSFVAGTLGYLISPQLAQNKYFLVSTILTAFWGTTLINLRGMQSSARFSNFCGIAGLILPMTLIISLGVAWLAIGRPMQVGLSLPHLIPNLHEPTLWISLTGIMMSFCGMEIATVHARDVVDPQRAFPKAILYSTLIILSTLILGSLAIAIVLPHNQISLVAGIMQAYHAFFNAYHLNWLLPIVAAFLVIGGLGGVSNWIIAPTKGLLIAGRDGNLPCVLQDENAHGAPKWLLVWQAVIVSLLSIAFLIMPSVNGSYWLLNALAAQLYMLMYILMFAACIRLRFTHGHLPRIFKIPGGKVGVSIVAGLGIISALVTLVVGFFPPTGIPVGSSAQYDTMIIIGLLLMSLPPFISYRLRKDEWQTTHYETAGTIA